MGYPTEPVRLEWSPDYDSPKPQLRILEIDDQRTLDRALDSIAKEAEKPLIVELVGRTGARLGIGLGMPTSVLAFNPSDDPPYYMSRGSRSSPRDDIIVYYFQGHWTEFPVTAVVPIEDAREAARVFFLTDERPSNVDWEEV